MGDMILSILCGSLSFFLCSLQCRSFWLEGTEDGSTYIEEAGKRCIDKNELLGGDVILDLWRVLRMGLMGPIPSSKAELPRFSIFYIIPQMSL